MDRRLKIQSISDIVTNSSDETFMVDNDYNDYLWDTFFGSHGAELIANERVRQMKSEGFTLDRDDHYDGPVELLEAAMAYIQAAIDTWQAEEVSSRAKLLWPWADQWFKPGTTKRNLEKGGALVAAAIDYIERN